MYLLPHDKMERKCFHVNDDIMNRLWLKCVDSATVLSSSSSWNMSISFCSVLLRMKIERMWSHFFSYLFEEKRKKSNLIKFIKNAFIERFVLFAVHFRFKIKKHSEVILFCIAVKKIRFLAKLDHSNGHIFGTVRSIAICNTFS